jgi:AcrR family transcriptional regulator
MTEASATPEAPTRQRIIDSALRLFAEQGYHGTTVGAIEAAAGLTPRAGGLYKHFPSKEALLEAAMQQRTEAIDHIDEVLQMLPLGDLRAELTLVARYALNEIRAEQQILRIVMKEGDQFPELRREFHERFVRRGYGQAAEWTRRTFARNGIEEPDLMALVAVAFGPIVNFPLMETLFGEPPAGVDEERFVATWVEETLALLRSRGVAEQPEKEEATA